MSTIDADMGEVRKLAADLTKASQAVVDRTPQIVERGAVNIKKQLRAEAEKSRYFRIAPTISYDLRDRGFIAEIGPAKRGAGNLANIAYFGGAHGGGGTITDPKTALDQETPRFMRELEKIIEKEL